MNLFNIMATQSITELCNGDLAQVFAMIGIAFKLLLIGIPVILVLFGLMDLGKAVMAGKDDEIKGAQKMLIKRIIYTVLAFFFVLIVTTIVGMVDASGSDEVAGCIKTIFNGATTTTTN